MSVNKKTAGLTKKAASFVFSALCGYIASTLVILVFSAAMYVLGLPPRMADVLSIVSFGAGCFICGLICGIIKKRGGLKSGVICAAVMTAPILFVSAVADSFSPGEAAAKLTAACICCCAGSVVGVNTCRER